MIDAFGIERSEVSKAISPNQLKALSNIAGTEGAAAKYAQGRLAANAAGREAAKSRPRAFAVNSSGQATRVGNGRPSAVGRVQRESSRGALSAVAREPRAGSVASTETAAANAIKNNRTRSQKVLQAVGSGSRAVGTRVRAVGSSVGSGTARAGRAVGSGTVRASRAVGTGTVRATRAVGSGTARAGRSVRGAMTRTPKPAAVTPAAAPAAATGTEAGTTTVKNKSNFKRNAALVGGGALAGAGGMAYNANRRNQTMSKSAFGVDHEVSKAEEKKASWRRYGSAAAVGPLHGAFAGKEGRKIGATAREYVGQQLGGIAGAGAGLAAGQALYSRSEKKNKAKAIAEAKGSKGKPLHVGPNHAGVPEVAGSKEHIARVAAKYRGKAGVVPAALFAGSVAGHYGGQALGVRENQRVGAYKPETVRKSAFGVTHEVSKFVAGGAAIKGIGAITKPAATLKPIAATKAAYQGGRAANLNRATSAGYAAGVFARKIPKTAVAIGAAGGAGIGYAAAKNNR